MKSYKESVKGIDTLLGTSYFLLTPLKQFIQAFRFYWHKQVRVEARDGDIPGRTSVVVLTFAMCCYETGAG